MVPRRRPGGNPTELFEDGTVPFGRSLWNSAVVGVLHTLGTSFTVALSRT